MNEKDAQGRTPLIVAIESFLLPLSLEIVVGILLQKGADPLLADDRGKDATDYMREIFNRRSKEIQKFIQTEPKYKKSLYLLELKQNRQQDFKKP